MAQTVRDLEVKVKYIADFADLSARLGTIKQQTIDLKISDASIIESIANIQNRIGNLKRAFSEGMTLTAASKEFSALSKDATNLSKAFTKTGEQWSKAFAANKNQEGLRQLDQYAQRIAEINNKLTEWELRKEKMNSIAQEFDIPTQARGTKNQPGRDILRAQLVDTDVEGSNSVRIKAIDEYNGLAKMQQELTKGALQTELKALEKTMTQLKASAFTPEELEERKKRIKEITTATSDLNSALGKQQGTFVDQTREAKTLEINQRRDTKALANMATSTFMGVSLSNFAQKTFQTSLKFYKEFDATLTRTMMVTGKTRDEVNGLIGSYNALATELNSTTKEVAAAQLVFYQQGLSTRDAMLMTEASIAISKTGGIAAEEAANRLTAAVRGYQLAATESMAIADKMSALDAAAASSVDELTVAMSKSASQARMAGLDLDYYMAYLATMQEVTREAPENIGTAMKSITARMQEIRDIGKIEEDGTTFNNVAKALNSIGVAATDSAGQIRPLQEIMNELGPMWKTLDQNHKAYISTVLAGNRQQSRFIALMDNYERALELVDVSQGAAGESARQLRAYNTGLEASLNRLQNAWQIFASQLIESSAISSIVRQLASFIELINKFPSFAKGAIGLIAINKAIGSLSGLMQSNLGQQMRELFDTKPNADNVKWYDTAISRVKAYFQAHKEGQKVLEEGALSNEKYDETLQRGNKSQETSTQLKLQNNVISKQEQTQDLQLTSAEQVLADAYNAATIAIDKNAKALSMNDEIIGLETNQALAQAREALEWSSQNLRLMQANVSAIKPDLDREIAGINKSYESKETGGRSGDRATDSYLRSVKGFQKVSKTDLDKYHAEMLLWERQAADDRIELAKEKSQERIRVETDALSNAMKARDDAYNKYIQESNNVRKEAGLAPLGYSQPDQAPAKGGSLIGAITTPMMIKSLTQMGTSIVGVNGATSDLIGSLTSMGYVGVQAFKEIASSAKDAKSQAGTIVSVISVAAVSIISIIGSISKMMNGLESNQEKLDKVLEERASLDDRVGSGKKAMQAYDKLSRKIIRTEGDQNELNSAANTLADIMPEIVTGYDSMGNAIINAVVAQQKLNDMTKQQVKLDNQSLDLYEKTTKAKGASDPLATMGAVGTTAFSIATMLGTATAGPTAGLSLPVAYAIAGLVTVAAGGISALYNFATESKRTKEALIEDRDEIVGALKSTTQVMEQYTTIRDRMVEQVYTEEVDSGGDVASMRKRLESMSAYLNSNAVSNIINKAKIKVKDPNLDYAAFREEIITGLKAMGMTDEEIDLSYGGIINIIFEGEINFGSIMETLQGIINNSEGQNSSELVHAAEELSKLNQETILEIYKAGLMDETFMEKVFGDKDATDIYNYFYSSGIFNPAEGIGKLLNEGYAQINDLYDEAAGWQTAIDAWGKAVSDGKKRQQEIIEELGANPDDVFNGRTWNTGELYTAQTSLRMGDISQEEYDQMVYDKIDSIQNFTEAQREMYKEYYRLNQELPVFENALESNKEALAEVDAETVNLTATNEELIKKWREIHAMPSFQEMADTVNEAIAPLKSLNDVLQSIHDQGGKMTFDNLSGMLGALEQIQKASLEAGVSTSYFNEACRALADGLEIQNGMITLNMNSTQLMQQVAAASYNAQIQQMQNKIEMNIAEMTMQRDMLNQQISFLEQEILTASDGAEAEGKIETELQKYLEDLNLAAVQSTQARYKDELTVASAYYSQLTAMAMQHAKGELVDASKYQAAFGNLVRGVGNNIKQGIDFQASDWKAQTETYINSLKSQRDKLTESIEGQGYLKSKLAGMLASDKLDLGKSLGNGLDKANSDLDEYIGKLERTINLIQQIDRLQHQIDDNAGLKDLYKDVDGTKYANSLLKELNIMEQQYAARKSLFDMQQDELGRQRGKMEDSPYANLFSFNSEGLLQLDWDTYNNLAGQHQEEIDILVERYETLQDAVESTEIELASYAKAMKSAWEEVRETVIKAENTIVDAIKNREKILHTARIKALDDEINMIQKAADARKKANDARQDEKDLVKSQEALRRAMLDTSGKNNSELLRLQEELEEKQLEIAEKRFDQDLKDRQDWLNDTKDAETETYQYRLETMTWYWEETTAIMNSGTENIMLFLMQWDESYRVTSETQQDRIKQGWQTMYDTIQTLYDKGWNLDTFHNQMNSIVRDLEAQKINIESIATAWESATKKANAYSAAIKNTGGGMINTGSVATGDTSGGGSGSLGAGLTAQTKFIVGDNVKISTNGILPGQSPNYYDSKGVKKGESMFEKKGAVIEVINVSGMGNLYRMEGLEYFYKESDLKKYAQGGMVDYTGPAWVDGTKSNPEAFLSAYQTQQVGALAQALDTNSVQSFASDVTIGNVSFNVASMSSPADGKKALDAFVAGANDLMSKKGIGTRLSTNTR